MSGLIPINRDSTDPFYRYKMPPLSIIREGRQGNPRTLIINFLTVCDSLKRQPGLIKQFYNYQLSVQIKYLNGRLILNGEFNHEILQNCLYQFINMLIICKHCDNPETTIKLSSDVVDERNQEQIFLKEQKTSGSEIKDDFENNSEIKDVSENDSDSKNGVVNEDDLDYDSYCDSEDEPPLSLVCYACGGVTPVKSNHKIIQYIIKNPDCNTVSYKDDIIEDIAIDGLNIDDTTSKDLTRKDTIKKEDATNQDPTNEDISSKNMNSEPIGTEYFNRQLTDCLKEDDFSPLTNLKDILKDVCHRTVFFECLEQFVVQNDIVSSLLGQIFKILSKILPESHFEYFRKKSKVIQKKESVRIRNILGNFVNYKEQ
ncbi:eukaryotic translation initiation factor eIF-5 [Pseudoloma neurophilia]|uniref:Eukaryotic translation initiation factor eIF-5 n=1 Tax=Pseudoloma neurophilia TaxID=146866 RepID=A0A0R0M6Y1_9MICR|nr:eukaryotic translation initiation factor eIF-5 [Pseudoloma neurophilia]